MSWTPNSELTVMTSFRQRKPIPDRRWTQTVSIERIHWKSRALDWDVFIHKIKGITGLVHFSQTVRNVLTKPTTLNPIRAVFVFMSSFLLWFSPGLSLEGWHPHRHTWRSVSWVIPNPVRLTERMSHCLVCVLVNYSPHRATAKDRRTS